MKHMITAVQFAFVIISLTSGVAGQDYLPVPRDVEVCFDTGVERCTSLIDRRLTKHSIFVGSGHSVKNESDVNGGGYSFFVFDIDPTRLTPRPNVTIELEQCIGETEAYIGVNPFVLPTANNTASYRWKLTKKENRLDITAFYKDYLIGVRALRHHEYAANTFRIRASLNDYLYLRPEAGSNGTLAFEQGDDGSVTVTWMSATDMCPCTNTSTALLPSNTCSCKGRETAPPNLKYKLYYAENRKNRTKFLRDEVFDMETVCQMEDFGKSITNVDWMTGHDSGNISFVVTGLENGTEYYFNIMTQNEAGETRSYTAATAEAIFEKEIALIVAIGGGVIVGSFFLFVVWRALRRRYCPNMWTTRTIT